MGQVFLKDKERPFVQNCKKSVSFTEALPWYNGCKFIAWEVLLCRKKKLPKRLNEMQQ